MDILDNSLRIKVTGLCNRNCFFCHEEGGMGHISDIKYTEELRFLIQRLMDECNISKVALTGGEPLLYSNLTEFIGQIHDKNGITRFSITTNGTIQKSYEFWKVLKDYGLYKVNISISDIITTVDSIGSEQGVSIFENQIHTIQLLNQLDIIPTINIVVYNDHKYLENVLNSLFYFHEIDYNIALLHDLTNEKTYEYSEQIIVKMLSSLECTPQGVQHRVGTSNTVYDYATSKNRTIQVKTTKRNGSPKWIQSICKNCPSKPQCEEGFYGIRVENVCGQIKVRLCLYKSDPSVLLNIEDFISSPAYGELCNIWGN